MVDSAIRQFCADHREWLRRELESEDPTDEEARAHVLHHLEVDQVSVGLYGRTVVRLRPVATLSKGSFLLPAHRFTTGDEVEIRSKTASKFPGGVVSEVCEDSIAVALVNKQDGDDEEQLGTPPLSLIPQSSIAVHRKLMAGLEELERHGTSHPVAGKVVEALFAGRDEDKLAASSRPPAFEPFNVNLDSSQLASIAFCLTDSKPVTLVHGPPGTGKTTTVVELIQQAVARGSKVLVTAPSNVAVDNVLARLVGPSNALKGKRKQRKAKLKVVRLGHPARLQAEILPYSLEALVQQSDGTEIVHDVRMELNSYLKVLASPKARSSDKRLAYKEIKALRKEVRQREEKVVDELLHSAQVVLATCVGAANRLCRSIDFDVVVIDEAAQALEAACWIPALRGKKLVLAGDHCQLPPTIKSNNPQVQRALSVTMFERCMALYGDDANPTQGRVSRMLEIQYRMHQTIADWASHALYFGRLKTHESVRDRTLSQLTGQSDASEPDSISDTALLLIDTASCHLLESTNSAGSRYNTGEADLVAQHVAKLIGIGVRQEQIAIITPYNGQVEILRNLLLVDYPRLEIRSVDGFQGGEREAVVLSLVRSSERSGNIGFLRDNRRLNVAVTRAKRQCCVVCDTETVSNSLFIKGLIDWMGEHGEHRSALEFTQQVADEQLNDDLRQAEIQLGLSMDEEVASPYSSKSREKGKEPSDNSKLEELLLVIRQFASSGQPGDSLPLSSELSKYDRKAVHEEAELLGIGHRSEGEEGVNRRITVFIEASVEQTHSTGPILIPPEVNGATDDASKVAEDESAQTHHQSASLSFSALVENDAVDSDSSRDTAEDRVADSPEINSVLGDLAKERAKREHLKQKGAQTKPPVTTKRSGKKKSKGQRLGGAKTAQSAGSEVTEGVEELDDMAFLNAQIEKMQSSHGRKLEGKGSYRTVINGILIAKPEKNEPKKNERASSALQAKLKQSQNSRKAKTKAKK